MVTFHEMNGPRMSHAGNGDNDGNLNNMNMQIAGMNSMTHAGQQHQEQTSMNNNSGVKRSRRTDEESRRIRLEQNRVAARESRKKKKAMVEELQQRVSVLSQVNSTLRNENEKLTNFIVEHAHFLPNDTIPPNLKAIVLQKQQQQPHGAQMRNNHDMNMSYQQIQNASNKDKNWEENTAASNLESNYQDVQCTANNGNTTNYQEMNKIQEEDYDEDEIDYPTIPSVSNFRQSYVPSQSIVQSSSEVLKGSPCIKQEQD